MRVYFSLILFFSVYFLTAQDARFGILDQQAPAWEIPYWIDESGQETALDLSDYGGKVVYLFCFQHWCPGCHEYGFPTLKYLHRTYKHYDDVAFVAVQTVFEGQKINTTRKLKKTQKKYGLEIPFGQDTGANMGREHANLMHNYRTGGTPWVIIIDKSGKVIFNDYHIEAKYANRIIRKAMEGE